MNPFKLLFNISDALEMLVFAVCGLFAAALLIAGPLFLTYRFFLEQRYLAASVSAVVWLAFAAAGIRDICRRQFSWASGSLFAVWLALALAIHCGLES